MKALILLALLPSLTIANGVPAPPVDPVPTPTTVSSASASASAEARALAGAAAKSDQFQSQQQSQQVTNEGNSLSANTFTERSAPPIFVPPAFPAVGCGRGVSVGGAGINGGGALAFNWAGKACEEFARNVAYAQAFSAIGMNARSCEVLLHHPMAKEVWPDGVPSCAVAVVETPPTVIVEKDTSVDVRIRELNEKMDRMFRKELEK